MQDTKGNKLIVVNGKIEYADEHGLHECPDWDYMEIDDTMPEWECCTCEEFK